MIISLIAAIDKNRVIGAGGALPWRLPEDLRFFSRTTMGHCIVTGRKNYESIPQKFRPLPGRHNIIVTRNPGYHAPGTTVVPSVEEAIAFAQKRNESELFIIGGGEIFEQTIGMADRLYITHVDAQLDGDTFFPEFDPKQWHAEELMRYSADDVHNFDFKICLYAKKPDFSR